MGKLAKRKSNVRVIPAPMVVISDDDAIKRGARRRSIHLDIELYMECETEELCPAQRSHMRKLHKEYNDSLTVVRNAQKDPKCQLIRLSRHDEALPLMPRTLAPLAGIQTKPVNPPIVINLTSSPPSSPKRITSIKPVKSGKIVDVAAPRQATNQMVPMAQVPMSQANSRTPVRVYVGPNKQDLKHPNNTLMPSTIQLSLNKNNPTMVTPVVEKNKTPPLSNGEKWVALDQFYYGKKEGDLSYREEKGEHRFKCCQCSKLLLNNLKLMMHTQAHIDCDKQQNLDLADLTQCKHCYQQFDTPFDMQSHIDEVHSRNTNALMCRICEKDHTSHASLSQHMRLSHVACEMPYVCQLCYFRSSLYQDVVDHFKKKHESSSSVLCLYCLKVFRISMTPGGWGRTMTYFQHVLKHQSKTHTRKCTSCKLVFVNAIEVKMHKSSDHGTNVRSTLVKPAEITNGTAVMIKVPVTAGVTSLNDPGSLKKREFGGLKVTDDMEDARCWECGGLIHAITHFRKYVECTMCRFATCCNAAYANHMVMYHTAHIGDVYMCVPTQRPLTHSLHCICGFSSKFGNLFANHMVTCSKTIGYLNKPQLEPQTPPFNDADGAPERGSSLLDILGLMKRRTKGDTPELGSDATAKIVGGDDFVSDYLISKRKRKAPRHVLTGRDSPARTVSVSPVIGDSASNESSQGEIRKDSAQETKGSEHDIETVVDELLREVESTVGLRSEGESLTGVRERGELVEKLVEARMEISETPVKEETVENRSEKLRVENTRMAEMEEESVEKTNNEDTVDNSEGIETGSIENLNNTGEKMDICESSNETDEMVFDDQRGSFEEMRVSYMSEEMKEKYGEDVDGKVRTEPIEEMKEGEVSVLRSEHGVLEECNVVEKDDEERKLAGGVMMTGLDQEESEEVGERLTGGEPREGIGNAVRRESDCDRNVEDERDVEDESDVEVRKDEDRLTEEVVGRGNIVTIERHGNIKSEVMCTDAETEENAENAENEGETGVEKEVIEDPEILDEEGKCSEDVLTSETKSCEEICEKVEGIAERVKISELAGDTAEDEGEADGTNEQNDLNSEEVQQLSERMDLHNELTNEASGSDLHIAEKRMDKKEKDVVSIEAQGGLDERSGNEEIGMREAGVGDQMTGEEVTDLVCDSRDVDGSDKKLTRVKVEDSDSADKNMDVTSTAGSAVKETPKSGSGHVKKDVPKETSGVGVDDQRDKERMDQSDILTKETPERAREERQEKTREREERPRYEDRRDNRRDGRYRDRSPIQSHDDRRHRDESYSGCQGQRHDRRHDHYNDRQRHDQRDYHGNYNRGDRGNRDNRHDDRGNYNNRDYRSNQYDNRRDRYGGYQR